MSTNKELLEKSVAHYDRMIEWYKSHMAAPPIFVFSPEVAELVKNAIGESWMADDCVLCETYTNGWLACEGCPIALDGHPHCDNTPWYSIQNAQTKGTLLKSLIKERNYLNRLYLKEKA